MANKAAWKKFETSMKEKRTGTRGKDILIKQRLTVQQVSEHVSGVAQKYSRIGPRQFVPYENDDLTIESVKEACMHHYQSLLDHEMDMESMECDVLAGDQGPSCDSFDQVPNPDKVIHVRFKKVTTSVDSSVKLRKVEPKNPKKKVKLMQGTSSAKCASKDTKSPLKDTDKPKAYPKSLSVIDMLKLGKVIEDKYESIELSSFDLSEMRWSNKPIQAEFSIENIPIGTGAFRMAFKAKCRTTGYQGKVWVVKKYLMKAIEDIKAIGQDIETQTRKVVQMHMLAQNMCIQLEKELERESVLELYGETLKYNTIYLGRITDEIDDLQWATVEEFIPGKFTKYINNDGEPCGEDTLVRQKCESLAHFSYEKSSKEIMVVDMQGSGHNLFDPEVASSTLTKDGEVLFAAGNLSTQAIKKFFLSHTKCNDFCTYLGLKQPEHTIN